MLCESPEKKSLRQMVAIFVSSMFLMLLLPLSAFCGSDNFIDSDDYKSKDFRKGILADYSDLKDGDNVNWAWVAAGISLADYKISIDDFDDATEDLGKSQLNGIKALFKENMEKAKGDKGTLSATIRIYEVQKYSPAKAWIPFAGGHQMQAGVGAEVLLKDKSGKAVGKIRHFAREGVTIETAAEETATDIRKFINKN